MKINRQFTLVLTGCIIVFAIFSIAVSYQVLGRMQEAAALNFLETTSRFAGSIMNDQTHEFEAVGAALLAAERASEGAAAGRDGETGEGAEVEGGPGQATGADARAAALPELETLRATLPNLSFAILTDAQGNQIAATTGVSPNADAAFSRYFRQLRNSGASFMGSLDTFPLEQLYQAGSTQLQKCLTATNTGEPLTTALVNSAVITNADQSLFLVLGEVVNNSPHYPDQYSAQVNGSFLSYVVDNHRIATNLAQGTDGSSQLGTHTPIDLENLPDDGYLGKELSPAGYYYYYLYTPVKNYWGENVAAKAVGIREAVYSSLIHNNIWAIIMMTLVAVPIVMLVGQVVSLRITQPLKASKRMAEAIMRNDFHEVEQYPVPANPINETDQLAASLQRMAVNLGESQQRVRDYTAKLEASERSANELSQQLLKANENLEAKVDARTLELRQLVDELSISNSTKTRFIANISHELKTPLTSSISAADLLLDQIFGELNDKQVEYLRTIKKSSAHLLNLINDILSLAKIDEGRSQLICQALPVRDLVDEVVVIVLGTYPDRAADIVVAIQPPQLQAVADAASLRQILFNLITNALKFSDPGSAVTISAQHWTVGETAGALFSVEDAGIGVAEEDFERVFYEFEQVDNSYSRTYEGTGLGLPIARRQAEAHGGKLWLESTLGAGTKVSFFLPQTDEASENDEEGE